MPNTSQASLRTLILSLLILLGGGFLATSLVSYYAALKSIRNGIVSRWGGEEFALLLKDTSLETAGQVAEKLRRLAEELAAPYGDGNLAITVSIGLTCLQADDSLDSLIARADRALYRAKQSGRNRVCLDVGSNTEQATRHD